MMKEIRRSLSGHMDESQYYQRNSALKAFMGDNKAHVKEYETAQSIIIRYFPDDSVP